MTPDTLFEVGSLTKPLTATLAATLVDDGLLAWETPVADLLPGFAVADPALTARLTLADLLCACSGLPARDEAVFWNADRLDPRGLVASLTATEATAPVGERFQYSNQVFSVGGYAATAAAGAAPDDLLQGYRRAMRERVLGPVGMPRSTFDLDAVLAGGDHALPHAIDLEGRTVPLPLLRQQRPLAAVDPAAGLWSSGREMAAFLRTMLAGGVAPDGTRVVSAANLERAWGERVSFAELEAAALGARGYGLGWIVGEEQGWRRLGHSGSTPGFVSELALLPEAGLGIVVLTNGGNGGALAFAARQRLFELLFGLPPEAETAIDQAVAIVASGLAGQRALIGEVDPAAVAPFVGRYANPTLGEVVLTMRDGRLIFDAGEIRSELRPLRTRPDPDVRYVFTDPGTIGAGSRVTLRRDAGGRPELVLSSLSLPADPTLPAAPPPTYVFAPVAPAGTTPVP